MKCVYNKEYLKKLNIQRSYLNRFAWDEASYPLRLELVKAVKALDLEIKECQYSLAEYKRKMEFEKSQQITIFDN